MKNIKNKSNFLTLLWSFSLEEIKNFEKHLNKNYASSKVTLNIFRYYAKLQKEQKPPPSFEVAYKKIFKSTPQKPRAIDKLRNGLSDLYLIATDYLLFQKVKEKGFEREWMWLQILENRSLKHLRDLQLKKLKSQVSETKVKNIWTSLEQLQLNHFEFFKNDFKKNISSIELINDGLKNIDEFYISMQLKYATEDLNRALVFSLTPTRSPLLDSILEIMKENSTSYSIQSQFYYHAYIFVGNKNYPQFKKFKNFLFQNEHLLTQEERLTGLIYSINFLSKQLKKNELKYPRETFELYQWGLKNEKILVYNGLMDDLQFRNIVNVACRLKEIDWVKNFITTHQQFLGEKNKNSIVQLSTLMIHFAEGKFEMVIDDFENKLDFQDVYFGLLARIFWLASQYELGLMGKLEMSCESFNRFIKRHKNLGEGHKNAGSRFSQILLQLMRAKSYKKEIKQNIEEGGGVYFKGWLADKLATYKRI